LSKTGANAAFYSDTFPPSGIRGWELGTMTLGERDGAPFSIATDRPRPTESHGGHIPPESIVANRSRSKRPDRRRGVCGRDPIPTNFKLFAGRAPAPM
jgi:hypothetical protein